MATIGYARTSTTDQTAGLEAQRAELAAAGCGKVFAEHGSGVDAARPELAKALDYAREGDVFVVAKPDRLARSVSDLLATVRGLQAKGVEVRILSMQLDTTTPTGKLILGVLGSVGEFERELMLERQKAGIANAKTEGRYAGRKPTARAKSADVIRLHKDGKNPAQIVREAGIGRASVYRILGDAGLLAGAPA